MAESRECSSFALHRLQSVQYVLRYTTVVLSPCTYHMVKNLLRDSQDRARSALVARPVSCAFFRSAATARRVGGGETTAQLGDLAISRLDLAISRLELAISRLEPRGHTPLRNHTLG